MNADTLVSIAKLLIALAILCPLVFPRLRGNLQFMDFADRWYGEPLIVIAIFVGLFVFAMFATKYGWLSEPLHCVWSAAYSPKWAMLVLC